MKYHLFTAVFLIAAFLLYVAGFGGGGIFLLAAGVILEMGFWIRFVRGNARRKASVRLAAR